MAMATALRKLSSNALRGQPASRLTPLYSMVRRLPLFLFFLFLLTSFLVAAVPISVLSVPALGSNLGSVFHPFDLSS
jgi:hypothetical protein